MNKAELVEAISMLTNQKKSDTESCLNAFVQIVTKNLQKKGQIKLVGFGTFATADRKNRVGRNPQTSEEIRIPARTVPVFRPGKELKQSVMAENSN